MFRGSIVAIVTPFKNGAVDEEKLRELVEFQIAGGTDAIVPCGTTGESSTLDYEEHDRVIEVVVQQVNKRVPVIAGTGSNSTNEAIEMTAHAKKIGADGALLVTPYYNKPTQEGLYHHYKAIATAVSLPIVVYSVQGRTGVNLEPLTLKRLAEIDNIVGVKEASGNLAQVAAIVHHVPERFAVLSGDDAVTIAVIALGGRGLISTSGNEIPGEMAHIVRNSLDGNFAAARDIQRRFFALMEVNFIESNPIPVKAAMAAMGLLEPVWRLPLVPPSPISQKKIESVLDGLGLLAGRSVHAG